MELEGTIKEGEGTIKEGEGTIKEGDGTIKGGSERERCCIGRELSKDTFDRWPRCKTASNSNPGR
jgi:hypothetical protein